MIETSGFASLPYDRFALNDLLAAIGTTPQLL
jgi:hypothetical protein